METKNDILPESALELDILYHQ